METATPLRVSLRGSVRVSRAVDALALAFLIGAQLALFARALDAGTEYDEGVYLESLHDLRAGQELGSDIAVAQPPGLYYGLWLSARVFGSSVEGVRTGYLVAFVAGAVGAYLLGRSLGGRLGGFLAVAFVGLAPPVPLYAVRVLADLPSLWLMLLSLGLGSLRPGERLRPEVGAGAAGLALGVAVFIKPTAAIALVPLALLLVRGSSSRRALTAALAGLVGATVVFALANARRLHALWHDIVVYRKRASELPDLLSTSDLFEQVLNARAAFTAILVLALVVATLVVARFRSFRPLAPLAAPVSLLALAWVATFAYRPLHANHVVLLSVSLALAAATTIGCGAALLGRRAHAVVAVAAVTLVVPAYAQAWSRVGTEATPRDPAVAALARRLAAVTSEGSLVVTDQPIVAFLARRETPGRLVDLAELRFATGAVSAVGILRDIDELCVDAVVVGRAMGVRPALVAGIRRRYRRVEVTPAGTLFHDRVRSCGSDDVVRP